MNIHALVEVKTSDIDWNTYDVIFLASGFEARSSYILGQIPESAKNKCITLGFENERNILSRTHNDEAYKASGITPYVDSSPLNYELFIKKQLQDAAAIADGRTLRVLVDYSVMTRVWYAYILTWLRHSGDTNSADIDFIYCHGMYEGQFANFQIEKSTATAGFEGVSAGSRRTIALYGLGYDKLATLAIHEIIQPDNYYCYIASDEANELAIKHVTNENHEIIEHSSQKPLILPLCNLENFVKELISLIDSISDADEIMAIPMGPKTHILGTLLVGHFRPRLTCIHMMGSRKDPVQVKAQGRISCWRIQYRQN